MSRGVTKEMSVDLKVCLARSLTMTRQIPHQAAADLFLARRFEIFFLAHFGPTLRRRLGLLTAAALRNFSFEPRKNRFDKSILDQSQHSFPSACLRRFYVPRDRGFCCHFLPRSILQQT